MFKVILVLALGLGAAMSFPRSRAVVMDFMAPALNPAFTWQTRGEMDRIARELQSLNRQGELLPEEGEEFDQWLARRFQGGSSLDAWGNPYTLKQWPDSVGVISAGPDTLVATSDDILLSAPIQQRRRH